MSFDFANRLVSAIRAHREDQEISVDRLAADAGLQAATIRLVENGQTSPSLPVLIAMTTALDISLGDLATGLGAETKTMQAALHPYVDPMLERLIAIGSATRFAFVVTDEARKLMFANRALTDLCGHSLEELLGNSLGEILQGNETNPHVVASVSEQLRRLTPFSFAITNYHRNGTRYIAGVYVLPVTHPLSERTCFVGLERELIEGEEPLADGQFADSVYSLHLAVEEYLNECVQLKGA